jgi:hypothetical protein
MKIEILGHVGKLLRKETKEIREDLTDVLEKLELGLNLSWPYVRATP